ncbi:MAG: DHH family phosphoesterase [Candidatus Nezhaarchaeota archaeon]|nr:DHH family phosphoesterase [Candidatus Nezhaarchaeota archaeon]
MARQVEEKEDVRRGLDKVLKDAENYAKKLLEDSSEKVIIVHHDDADGICAGALLKIALEDRFAVHTICLEKTFPLAIKRLQEQGKEPIIYVDLGSPHASTISALNKQKRTIVIIDHHDINGLEGVGEEVAVLNPEVHGIDGGVYACGASLAYFFAHTIKKDVETYSGLAVIGSVEIPGEAKGLNFLALNEALKARVAVYDEDGKRAKVLWNGKFTNPETISTKLTIMASVGYYDEGPQKALNSCIKCSWAGAEDYLDLLEEKRRRAYSSVIAKLRYTGLNKLKRIQWFHVEDSFRDMGVKVIGTFCSYLMHQNMIDEDKVLVGMMNMRSDVPGLGDLGEAYVKVSARAPKRVLALIDTGSLEPLSKALSEAAKRVGGFGDGHAAAASGVIPKGKEREFLELMDELLAKGVRKKGEKQTKVTLESFLFPKKIEK